MRRAVSQWLLMGFVLVWGASGCNCGEPPVESELTVAFDRPEDGARLALADDADPATDGFQYEVVALARDTADRPVKLASAKLELRVPSEQTWQPGPEAVIDGGTVRFPGTLLQPRTNVLQVTVVEEGSRRTATHRISVAVSTEPPSVDLTQPAEGQVLREGDDADPDTAGYQLRFSVKSTGLAGKAGTIFCEQACGVPPTDFTVNSSGLTQVSVTLDPSAACVAQEAACYAVVRTGSGAQDVQSGKRRITLDTVAPRVEVSSPVAPVPSRTFKVEAVVGCCEGGSTATLTHEGASLSARVTGGVVSFPEVRASSDGQFPYMLRITDSGGNVTEKLIPVRVASTPATLSLNVPTTVTTDADNDPANGIQVDATATTSASDPETQIDFYTTVTSELGNPVRLATTAVTGGGRAATLRVSLVEGNTNTVRACVRNPALPATCQALTVNVSTGRPACQITSPLDADVFGAAGIPDPVKVETDAASVKVRLLRDDGSLISSHENGTFLVPVALPAEDGPYRLVADCGASGVSQLVTVARDVAPPSLAVEVSGDAGDGVLGPATQDTSTQAGTQVRVTARTEPFTAVSLTGCGAGNSFDTVADATGLAVLREVSVPASGDCALSIRATDLAGNATDVSKPLSLALTRGALSLVSPAADRVLGLSDGAPVGGGGLTLDVRVGISGGGAGTLKLFVGASEVGSVEVAAGDTEKVFTGVALREGANVVRVTLSGAAGTAACVTSLLTVDTTPSAVTLENPATASSFGLVDDLSDGAPGIQRTLRYSVSAASEGARVDICSSKPLKQGAAQCRDGSDFYTLASDVAAFVSDFSFPDGQYSIKAVLDDGSFSSSQEVPLVVDSERPRVTRVTIEADTNGDGQLSLAEQPTGDPALLVTVAGLEDGRSIRVRGADGTVFGQALASAGAARVVLSGLPNLTEASYSLTVVATDGVGNSNNISDPAPLDPINTEAFLTLRIDRAAPTLTVSAPSKPNLGSSDDADAAQAGFQVRLTLTTSADVGTDGVEVTLVPPGTVLRRTPTGQTVSELLTLPASGTTAYELRLQAVDRAGNTTTLVRTFTVDLEAPVITVTSPQDNGIYTTPTIPLHADVTGAEGATVDVFRMPVGGGARTPVTSLTVTGGVASGAAALPRGVPQDILFEVRDAAGNLGSRTVSNVLVNFAGCDVRFTKPLGTPVTLTQQDDLDAATPGLQYRVEGDAIACPGLQVRLFRDGGATPEDTTTTHAVTSVFGFNVTLPDGQSTTLRAEMDDGTGLLTSASVVINVDISPPGISNVVPAETQLFFVADSNEALFLLTPTPGYIQDRVPDGDAEAELSARVTGAQGGSVRVTYNGTDVATPETPGSNDETVTLPITLPHNTTGSLVLLVRDAAGNEARHTVSATVDVLPPAHPMPQVALAAGAERTATVDVTWTAVGDDGMSGVPSGYDVRWAHEAVLLGGITDDATFFRGRVQRGSGSLLPAGSTSFALTPLPPMEKYSIQLRARDEVGNYSRFTPSQSLSNIRTRDVLDPGGDGTRFGFLVASNGNLDGVAGDDLAVADFNENSGQGAVYVFSGGDGTPQALVPPSDPSQSFGWDMSIGNVGDAAGEGKPDLLVGAPGWASARGRAFLYFGRTGAGVTGVDPNPIELRGTAAGNRFGIAARIIQDINQDGLAELALPASSENGNQGRVYLFFGRSRAAWEALRVDESTGAACTAGTTACIIPTSRADRVIDGEDATSSFGRFRGLTGLGDITGDGIADFGIPVSRETFNRYYLFSGEAVLSSPVPTAIPASSALQRLLQPVGTEPSSFNGFGMAALGGLNLIGGAGLDLVVSRARANTLFLYADGGASGFPNAPATILGSGNFGNSLASGDINLDGLPDLVVGTDRLDQGSAWVFYNTATGFDPLTGQFNQANLVGSGAKALGVSVAVGDFNADGMPDIAAGDNLDPVGRRVRIWY